MLPIRISSGCPSFPNLMQLREWICWLLATCWRSISLSSESVVHYTYISDLRTDNNTCGTVSTFASCRGFSTCCKLVFENLNSNSWYMFNSTICTLSNLYLLNSLTVCMLCKHFFFFFLSIKSELVLIKITNFEQITLTN